MIRAYQVGFHHLQLVSKTSENRNTGTLSLHEILHVARSEPYLCWETADIMILRLTLQRDGVSVTKHGGQREGFCLLKQTRIGTTTAKGKTSNSNLQQLLIARTKFEYKTFQNNTVNTVNVFFKFKFGTLTCCRGVHCRYAVVLI